MKTKIFVVFLVLVSLSIGGFFAWKNFFAPKEIYKGVWMGALGSSLVPDYFPEEVDVSSFQPIFADLDKAEEAGINTLAFQLLYWVDETGELTLSPEIKKFIADFIDEAHVRGFKIWLNPEILHRVDSGGPSEMRIMPEEWLENTDLLENFEEAIVETAKFAEEHNIEIFSPSSEMYVNIGRERSKKLIIDVKPKIDAVYSGKICLRGEWPKPEFSDYTCFGAPVDIPENEEEENKLIDNINFQISREDVEVELMVGELWEGNDWQGSQEDAQKGFEAALEIVEGKVTGVFILDKGRISPLFPKSFEDTIKEFYAQEF